MLIKILVVDDNRDTLKRYTKAIQRRIKISPGNYMESALTQSIVVEAADSVLVALQKLQEDSFEVLVVDLRIPGIQEEEMGGLQLISESLSLDPLRRIIVITAYGNIGLVKKTMIQGVFDFIEKSTTAIDELIDAVQRAIDQNDEKMLRSGNPFTPMTGIEPSIFGGRIEELMFFEQRLNRALNTRFNEHFHVLGNWGIGKSTLLREYKKICQSRGHIASIIPLESLQAGATLNEAARSLIEGILRDLPYPVDQFKKLAGYFDSVGISILGTSIQFKRDAAKKELSTQAFLHDTLLKLWQDLESKTSGVFLIILDDLDNFMTVPEIIMTLRQTLSMESLRNTKILVGIAATPNAWLQLISISNHHPLARYFHSRIELGPLKQEELEETIIKSISGTGITFSPEILTRVFEYTQGHPYEMQVLCYHLFNHQLSRRVGVDVWDKALQDAVNDLGNGVFHYWFEQASDDEIKILRIIAEAINPVSIKEIVNLSQAKNEEVTTENAEKSLQQLTGKKLVAKTGGLYILPDKMFSAYILTRIS